MTTADRAYRDLYFENPTIQAEFERLVQLVRDAELARQPMGSRQRSVEDADASGKLSEKEYRNAEDEYIAAGNKIAAAQRAVNAFLQQNRNYKTR